MFITACAALHKSLTFDRDETKQLPVQCKQNRMPTYLRRNIQAENFDKKFSLNVLPPNDFHMVMLAAVDDMLTVGYGNTAMTVTMFITACT